MRVRVARKPEEQIGPLLKGPKRLEGETYEAYRKRRREENGLVNYYLKGDWIFKAGYPV